MAYGRRRWSTGHRDVIVTWWVVVEAMTVAERRRRTRVTGVIQQHRQRQGHPMTASRSFKGSIILIQLYTELAFSSTNSSVTTASTT